MTKVVVAEYLSLDGVGDGPGGIGAFERRGRVILLRIGKRSPATRAGRAFPIGSLTTSGCTPPPGP